jgi:hypothetical protein
MSSSKFTRFVAKYRQQAYQPSTAGPMPTVEEMAVFINDLGFCVLNPRRDVELPILRTVASQNWHPLRDQLLTKRLLYYGRPFRRRTGLLSLPMLNALYGLSPAAKFEHDRFELYRRRFISAEANRLAGIVYAKGPLHTGKLRREMGMAAEQTHDRFKRIMIEAESKFLIARSGTTFLDGSHYTYEWSAFPHIYPEIAGQAAPSYEQSGSEIIERYVNTVGATTVLRISHFFGLYHEFVDYYARQMIEAGKLHSYKSAQKEFLLSVGLAQKMAISGLINR